MAYTLVITEKPSAAEKIAHALAEGGVKKLARAGVTCYRITRGGKEMVVVPAVGHLFVLTQKAGKWEYPVFDVKWEPVFIANTKNLWSKKYYQSIQSLVKDAKGFISATDYDVEGSVIAYNILRFICGVENAKRMKFSTLTKPDLVQAYENASERLDFGQVEAGLTRHQIDWYFGINVSRALTLALKEVSGYKTLSTGRVQGPTLRILQERQKEIDKFKPVPFWQLQLLALLGGEDVVFLHVTDKFWKKEEAVSILEKCQGKPATVDDVERREQTQRPPFPFDLTTLQREAYSSFGYSPKQTLDIAQMLYGHALISYPRTSSQKLPPSIGYKSILKKLAGQKHYKKLCEGLLKKPLKPVQGKKTDPAHPAIFPTGHAPKGLNQYQKKIYDMVVRRFMAVFAEPATREAMKVTLDIAGEKFAAHGIRTIVPGWMEHYRPYVRLKEQVLPKVRKGEPADIKKLEMLDKETQPPAKYSQASILKEMESLGLGTKGTRALILHTLYDRGYIKEKAIHVTALGEVVVTALEKYCPEIVSVEMTKLLEEEMVAIREGKLKRQDVIKRAEAELTGVLKKFKTHQRAIGEELLKGVKEVMREETQVGKCMCGGNLVIKYSRAHKRFVACDRYPKCTETFSLPHQGQLTILSENCAKCGLHVISVKRFKKRPWKLCVRCGFVSTFKKKTEAPAKEKPKASGKAGKAAP